MSKYNTHKLRGPERFVDVKKLEKLELILRNYYYKLGTIRTYKIYGEKSVGRYLKTTFSFCRF